jgi:hypothetical protein
VLAASRLHALARFCWYMLILECFPSSLRSSCGEQEIQRNGDVSRGNTVQTCTPSKQLRHRTRDVTHFNTHWTWRCGLSPAPDKGAGTILRNHEPCLSYWMRGDRSREEDMRFICFVALDQSSSLHIREPS